VVVFVVNELIFIFLYVLPLLFSNLLFLQFGRLVLCLPDLIYFEFEVFCDVQTDCLVVYHFLDVEPLEYLVGQV